MKLLSIIALVFALWACASRAPTPDQPDAMAPWQTMLQESARAAHPYRLQLAMRFGQEGDTRRITALLWGNGDARLRLDIMAGIGATLARISDSDTAFLLYSPREDRAYLQEGSSRPILKIGVPVPFTLRQLAELLTGQYAMAFGQEPASGPTLKDGLACYMLEGPLAGELTLRPDGAPVEWRQAHGGWSIRFACDEDSRLPKSIRLANINGKFAFISVKERETVEQPFDAAQLEIKLPSHIKPLPLAQYKP